MNKSKFLKKSLAALLAVMLVVAMVPLSAAAADLPALTKIYVDGDEKTANGKEFTANYTEGSTTVDIAAELPYGTKLEAYATEDGLTAVQNSAKATAITGTAGTYNISSFPEGIVYLRLQDNDGAGRANVTYTLKLVEVEPDMKTGVVAVEVTSDGKDNGLLNATIDQENLTINVEAAYGFGNAGKIALTPVAGGDILEMDDSEATNDEITVLNTGDTQFKVKAGGESTVWTIKVTKIGALLDFTVAGKQGEINHEDATITVNLTLDDIKNEYGEKVTDPELVVEYSTITNTTATAEIATAGTWADLVSGKKAKFTGLDAGLNPDGSVKHTTMTGVKVKNGSDGADYRYTLKVVIPASTDTTVSYAAIGGVEATVDGTNITAVLDKDTTGAQTLRLHVPVGAKVTPGVVTSPGNTTDDWVVTTTNTDYDVWETKSGSTKAVTADTPNTKKTFVVTAADTGYSVQYSIWYTVAEDQTEASLKSFNLKDGDNVYTGVVDEAKHNVTIEVPFMTTTMDGWKIFGTYSAGAIGEYNGAPIMSGITPVVNTTPGTTDLTVATNGNTQTLTDFIKVHSQGVDDVTTEYDLVVKFKKPNNGVKLTGVKVTAQKVDTTASPAPTQKSIVRAMNDTNTYDAVITEPKRDPSGATTELGEVKITTAYSQRLADLNDAKMSMPISNIETNGGIAYLYAAAAKTGTIKKFVKLDGTNGTAFSPSAINDLYQTAKANWGTTVDADGKFYIVVVPEEIAKKYDSNAAGAGAKIFDKDNDVDDRNKCAFYKVTLAENPANPQGKLESLTIAGQSMRIVGDKIIGTLPYSATREALDGINNTTNGAANANAAQFVEFKLSDYAKMGNAAAANAQPTNVFANKGDTDSDGEADAIGADNAKILFVRGDDHNVTAYILSAATDAASADVRLTTPFTKLSVYAEAWQPANPATVTNEYTFQLKYADANNQAAITEFDLNGYKGTISGTTINVSVPKATNLKALRASYKASTGATVALDNAFNDKISSGKTVLNCSSDVKIYVRSEDESKTEVYTLKVTEGEMFVDVTKDDWFYEEVNTAANNGWINGTGEGYFTPYGSMTRGQFALIIARMEVKDFDEETEVDCPFPDVEGTAYRAAAKYVYDQGYMQGDGDNFFNANDNITRAQAAIVLCKMKGIEPMTGDTDYDDDASIADWAKGYVKAATAAGIFKGEGDDFNPQRYLRRCEGAAILVRSANK